MRDPFGREGAWRSGLVHIKSGGMTRSHPGRSLGIAWRKGEVSRGSVGCGSAVPRRRQARLAALWWLVLAAAGSSFSVLAVVSEARAAKGIDRCAASHIDPHKAADGPRQVDEVAAASMAAKDDGDTHQGPGSLCSDAGQAARAAGRASKWRAFGRLQTAGRVRIGCDTSAALPTSGSGGQVRHSPEPTQSPSGTPTGWHPCSPPRR